MRLLLDAHVTGPRIGVRLTAAGQGVRALDQELAHEGLDDDEVLSLAAAEERILVTHNVRDFPAILREWAAAERSHAGAILVYGIDHRERRDRARDRTVRRAVSRAGDVAGSGGRRKS